MKIKQYALFVIYSDALLPEEISERVGLPPDQTVLRTSRVTEPPRPVTNIWRLRCDAPGTTVDAQLKSLVDRLRTSRAAIQALVNEGAAQARFEVVRYFSDDEGEEEIVDVVDGLEKIPGQHQLLGWELTKDVLDFFQDIGAGLWVDKYG